MKKLLSLALIAALALTGCDKDGDGPGNGDGPGDGDGFTAVTGIVDVPLDAVAGTPLTLSGTVKPGEATNQTIVWSIRNAGRTNAEITGGTTFTATAAGEAVVTATIAGGKTASTPYTQDFTIAVTPPVMTMTTAKEGVEFYLQGTGTATVDWGDGSQPETLALASDNDKTFRHTYSGTSSRTITITGGNVTYLNCSWNQLTALDVSKNTKLIYLYCDHNDLTALDVSKNTGLTYLDCGDNPLTALDVSKNTELTTLYCYSNQLTALDVSENTGLTELSCSGNQLTSLDVSKHTGLTLLLCNYNQFTAAGLDALFGTLHGNTVAGSGKTVYVGGNPGAAGCDATIATAKGWMVIK